LLGEPLVVSVGASGAELLCLKEVVLRGSPIAVVEHCTVLMRPSICY
jgi:hypothetical protein